MEFAGSSNGSWSPSLIGGIRDSGLYGATDKIEEMAYTKRIHLAT